MRKSDVAGFQQRADNTRRLADDAMQLRMELARLIKRQEALAAHGDKRLEVPQKGPVPGHGLVAFEPARSLYTGRQMAEQMQPSIEHISGEVGWRETAVQQFLDA